MKNLKIKLCMEIDEKPLMFSEENEIGKEKCEPNKFFLIVSMILRKIGCWKSQIVSWLKFQNVP